MRIADLTLRNSFALQNLNILTVQMLKTQKANKENPVYFVLQKLKFSKCFKTNQPKQQQQTLKYNERKIIENYVGK